jgi:quercetin dioxygenase-like cupin family protein
VKLRETEQERRNDRGLTRQFAAESLDPVADPDGAEIRHVSVVGHMYTILVSSAQTAGRYCLIDMLVPDGVGPPPHRHDFEEMFTLLEGELEFTFRGEAQTIHAGSTVNIRANAPHMFNKSGKTVHMLCVRTLRTRGVLHAPRHPSRQPDVAAAKA